MNTDGYKQALLDRRDELTGRLERISDDLTGLRSAQTEEQALESENDEVLESLGAAGETELRAIAAALARIKAGTYGRCVSCDEDIAPERLETLPATPFCQDCAPG
ncbi:TraR/DksA family transcriptional regulator [Allorhizobium taibaishanense]|uniref:Dimethylmenaquinone methyltransferase n=1 Tax=Allorhizobium taibaishanense TaxID=887144 RepID=A0A1Q8ZZJ3_9HYPH|nr:TraR/DksA C4-type zinc finger protein [Allorhizobium taibaishanense]MBB4007243.1 RNA polymerase-binding transcription factor DksA [Allorhizobium taibaishanense]OLP47755.1 dimethylmenaquinone methyltransferase [Allorhizobium taibaishanense]